MHTANVSIFSRCHRIVLSKTRLGRPFKKLKNPVTKFKHFSRTFKGLEFECVKLKFNTFKDQGNPVYGM